MRAAKILLAVALMLSLAVKAKAQKGEIYPDFPESFENKGEQDNYKKKSVSLKTGVWTMFGAKIDNFENDKPVTGTCAIRMLGANKMDYYLRTDFDLEEGASKVTFWYSSYAAKTDKPCKFKLEYSVNGGKKWKIAGDIIEAKSKTKEKAEYDLDLEGKVRFRIVKLGLGDDKEDPSINNGRLSIDDFAVYKK